MAKLRFGQLAVAENERAR